MAGTRQRVLECACTVFSEKGFGGGTVTEICERAGANISAVNYYFGNKENLYKVAVDFAFQAAEEQFSLLENGQEDQKTSEERLRIYIKGLFRRIFSEGLPGCYYKMMAHEFSNPESPVDHFFEGWNRPLCDIIEAVAQVEMPQREVVTCMINVNSACLFFSFNQRLRKFVTEGQTGAEDEVEEMALRVTEFALGGIRAVAESVSKA